MKSSRLKKFRALVVLDGCYHKGVIIQQRQINRRFFCGRPVMIYKKRGCNGTVCKFIQTE